MDQPVPKTARAGPSKRRVVDPETPDRLRRRSRAGWSGSTVTQGAMPGAAVFGHLKAAGREGDGRVAMWPLVVACRPAGVPVTTCPGCLAGAP
jgi:hypothetical protein